ncbi:MAG: SDR family oxidoreductase [Pseudomonadota bacterium]
MPSDTPTSSPSLIGQTVAVVGGSSGLGFAIAAEARRQGADLVLVARDPDRLRHAAAALGGAAMVAADIADPQAASALFDGIAALDHLVITAGTARLLPLAAHTAGDLAAVLAERLVGPLLAIKAAAPRLRAGGSITLTSAQLSTRPIAAGAVFAAAVAGVEAMARALALELAPIRVNALAPGLIDTPLLDALLGDAKRQVLEASAASVPARRVGRPQDVAQAALLLMTNGFITGEVLHVDGGGRWV